MKWIVYSLVFSGIAFCGCTISQVNPGGSSQSPAVESSSSTSSLISASNRQSSFRPAAGQCLLFIGQDLDSVGAYRAAVGMSSNETTYWSLVAGESTVFGLHAVANVGGGNLCGLTTAGRSERVAAGIWMNGFATNISDGETDAKEQIDDLAQFMITNPSKIFYLRIGYEFDNPGNGFVPAQYVAAFQYIVSRLRSDGSTNFNSVWQSYAANASENLAVWYPGSNYVDWCGMSWFSTGNSAAQDAVLDFARTNGKPVMICESTPIGIDISNLSMNSSWPEINTNNITAGQIWSSWYVPFLNYIHTNTNIQSVAYINDDWNSQPMWGPSGGNGYWGDTRVQDNPVILADWKNELGTWSNYWVR